MRQATNNYSNKPQIPRVFTVKVANSFDCGNTEQSEIRQYRGEITGNIAVLSFDEESERPALKSCLKMRRRGL